MPDYIKSGQKPALILYDLGRNIKKGEKLGKRGQNLAPFLKILYNQNHCFYKIQARFYKIIF
jgi:hypothetical protein